MFRLNGKKRNRRDSRKGLGAKYFAGRGLYRRKSLHKMNIIHVRKNELKKTKEIKHTIITSTDSEKEFRTNDNQTKPDVTCMNVKAILIFNPSSIPNNKITLNI